MADRTGGRKPAGLLLRPNECWVYDEDGNEHGPFVGVTEAVGKAWRLGLVANRLPVRRETGR